MIVFYPRQHRAARGMSLIEVLIAMVMITGIMLAMFGIIPYSFGQIQVNSTQIQATALGQQYLDALRNAKQSNLPLPTATTAPIDQGNSFLNSTQNAASGTFTIAPNPCPTATTATTVTEYDCSVTVSWTENGENQSTTVETYVTSQ